MFGPEIQFDTKGVEYRFVRVSEALVRSDLAKVLAKIKAAFQGK